jgi:nucleoside-diphosphate-sugar epimerase
VALPIDDPQVRQPDITRATTLLGWVPKVSLRDGMTRTVDFERQRQPHASQVRS